MLTYTGPIKAPVVFDPARTELMQRYFDNIARDGFENLGSDANVTFRPATSQNLKINGQAGNDIIDLGSTSTAAQGDHTVYGGTGNDIIQSGSGDDTLYGGFDDDTIEGGLGDDLIYGGQGDDFLVGDSQDFLTGGDDRIFGGTGEDTIIGLRGADEMMGGGNADRFVYKNSLESTMSARDHVLDFNRAEGDRFDFTVMDANLTLGGSQDLDFRGSASTQAGTLWVEGSGTNWTVFVNVDGGGADMAIQVTLAGGATSLVEADFLL